MEDKVGRDFTRKAGKRRRSSVMGYEQSLMFGQYREELASFARHEAQKAKALEETRLRQERSKAVPANETLVGCCARGYTGLAKLGGDWIILATLGIIIAFLSFLMDIMIHSCFNFRTWLVTEFTDKFVFQYLLWITFTVSMILFAALFVKYVSPQAAGSGVGEMKVILRGVVLKEYLSFKTLVAKIVGLPFVLGSGLPLGKEGPFVHISAMVANQLIKLFGSITSDREYESRFLEVVAVACAIGVAATFASPVGGVLYSIEIVSVFFAVRSYWQGFFAATWGAMLWRLLTVWFQREDSITHIFKTDFRKDHPYETLEIVAFALLGLLCGISAFIFVTLQRHIVLFNRRHTSFHTLLQTYPMIYPVLVTSIVAIVSFPPGIGQFYASWLSSEEAMHELFSNYSWGEIGFNEIDPIVDNWRTEHTSIYINTFIFFVMNLVVVALTSTMPVPLGLIVPAFKIGAGLGRLYGEGMVHFFPHGLSPYANRTEMGFPIIAGSYAVAGSAAFAGATTGALSSAVIAFEMTGQLTHLLPIIVCVIVANLVAQYLGPSVYDSLIKLKRLPYLPAIIQSSSGAHRIFVEDFMRQDLLYIWEGASYRYLRHLLNSKKHVNIYPFVKAPESMILLGTVERIELQGLLEKHLDMVRMGQELDGCPSGPPSAASAHCPIHGKRFNVVNVTIQEEEESVSPHGISSVGVG